MGWLDRLRDRPPSQSEVWARSLPPTPLHQHLASLHALLMYLGAEGDALALGEHHLRQIAVFTPIPQQPWERPPITTAAPDKKENES